MNTELVTERIRQLRDLERAANESQRLAERISAEFPETDLGTLAYTIGHLAGAIGMTCRLTADAVQELATENRAALGRAVHQRLEQLHGCVAMTEAQLNDPNTDLLGIVSSALYASMVAEDEAFEEWLTRLPRRQDVQP